MYLKQNGKGKMNTIIVTNTSDLNNSGDYRQNSFQSKLNSVLPL